MIRYKNANENCTEIPLSTIIMDIFTSLTIPSGSEHAEKLELLYISDSNVKMSQPF